MRYIIGLLVTFGLFILLIVLLVGGGDKPKVTTTSKSLSSYTNSEADVRLTIDDRVNANSEHRQERITVDRNNVTYELVKGYDGEVIKMQRFANTQAAYGTFLKALEHAGYTQGSLEKELADERGYCPLGTTYIMELRKGESKLQRFWANTCRKPKTYLGNISLTVDLFKAQVPGYADITDDAVL